ncbi:MAG: phosphoenolpyruvate carboxykinase (ATP) [Alphaproteobacteria bacterium]|nr:phosphoenolpyruvate carboxykinase (ATP) [Alphaproteobacteria bacterium]
MGAPSEARFVDGRQLVTPWGVRPSGVVYRNLDVDGYYQAALQRGQATVMSNGALLQDTMPFHGRAAKSSFYVNDPSIRIKGRTLDELIAWGNPAEGRWDNLPMEPERYERLLARVRGALSDARDLYVVDAISGRTPASRLQVRVISTRPASALFARNIFIEPTAAELRDFEPGWVILHAPEVEAAPDDGTNSAAFIISHVGDGVTIIGGTAYHGQIKKSIFCVQNFRLPLEGVLTMHAGASEGDGGASALHAGLSGTGKTTLSNTGYPVADDQIVVEIHGPADMVVSNMEGGQYAKTEHLRADKEPETFYAIGYGTTAENIAVDAAGNPDYDDVSVSNNGRVGYPLAYVDSAKESGVTVAPRNITFLTADGFGVLPPVARLTVEGGKYHFAAGFTSKMPGTEDGVVEPKPTFSAFFGKPFMPLKPSWYMDLLAELVQVHGTQIWLVNTGWLGPLKAGRKRVDITVSKAIINAVRDERIDLSPDNFWYHPTFKLHVPKVVPGVASAMLDPRHAWDDEVAYAQTANRLATIFHEKMSAMPGIPPEVLAAGPHPQA